MIRLRGRFVTFAVEHEVYLKHLSLANFRNYVRLEREFPPGIILIQGENAQGKTNLLEAIYYLATARSPYATADRELINWLAEEEDLTFARLVGQMQKDDTLQRLEITLLKEPSPANTYSLKKQIRINGVPKRVLDLIGQLNVVERILLGQRIAEERERILLGTDDQPRHTAVGLSQLTEDSGRRAQQPGALVGVRVDDDRHQVEQLEYARLADQIDRWIDENPDVEERISRGIHAARAMTWDHVVEEYLLPVL